MKDFLFRPEQARTPVSVLSGGERARLTLARPLARPSNLLVLDEPTNDLDLETLDLLQEKLTEYAGTVLLVSHDRDFLDRAVTSIAPAKATEAGSSTPAATPICWLSGQRHSSRCRVQKQAAPSGRGRRRGA
jgi:ATP-binding cassette subfamily F protein uup